MNQISTDTHAQARKTLENPKVQDALDSLSIKQRRYVVQMTIGMMSMSAAADDAGFSSPPKSRLVLHAITTLRVELARELDITLDDVKRGMMGAVNLAEAIGDPGNMLNGWDKLAKLLGFYEEENKPTINIENMTIIDMTELSEDELDELIAQRQAIEGQSERVG